MARRRCVLVVAVSGFMLGGCALVRPLLSYDEPARSVPAPALTAFADPYCREAARQRADDAAANGYDQSVQAATAREAYRTCLALKQGSALSAATP